MSKGIWGEDLDLKAIDDYLEECSISDDFLYPQYQIALLLNDYKEKIKEIERLNNIINELDNMFYESFRISQNGSYTITETDYNEIEHKLKELKGSDKE